MNRVIVIGCPGSGKSTFARQLQKKTGLPLVYLDMLFWNPDRTSVTREEFQSRLSAAMENSQWVIDGNYSRSLLQRLEACDTVFFLDYDLETCLQGVSARLGTVHPDLPWVEAEPDEEFLDYIRDFAAAQVPEIRRLLPQYPGKQIITFRTREQASAYLRDLTTSPQALWLEYCRRSGVNPETPYEAWSFGADPDLLAQLVVDGIKTATASGFELYALDASEPLPKPGDHSVILDSEDRPVCVIRTTRVYSVPYCRVSAEHAFREGEGDRSLTYWRQVHWAFFSEEYRQFGLTFTDQSLVLCEEFELLFTPGKDVSYET